MTKWIPTGMEGNRMISSAKISRFFSVALAALMLLPHVSVAGVHELPHYVFVLPDGYQGWIQVIFNASNAPKPEYKHNKIILRVDDSGIFKTSMIGTFFTSTHDEFFYKQVDTNGKEKLVPVPANFACGEEGSIDSCLGSDGIKTDEFTVGRANLGHPNDGTPGSSWFLFVGPPALREKYAKIIHRAKGEQYQIDVPEDDPKPGRINNEN